MQHGIGSAGHAFGPDPTAGGVEQRQQFRRPTPDVLMGLAGRFPRSLPRGPGLRNRLVGSGLILTPYRYPRGLRFPVRLLDTPLFSSVWGSTTVTTPALRFRWAVPVGHQVRVR
jgi:hypothetical protein